MIPTFRRARRRPNNATLVVVGDTTLSEIVPKLEAAFKETMGGVGRSIADLVRYGLPDDYYATRG